MQKHTRLKACAMLKGDLNVLSDIYVEVYFEALAVIKKLKQEGKSGAGIDVKVNTVKGYTFINIPKEIYDQAFERKTQGHFDSGEITLLISTMKNLGWLISKTQDTNTYQMRDGYQGKQYSYIRYPLNVLEMQKEAYEFRHDGNRLWG